MKRNESNIEDLRDKSVSWGTMRSEDLIPKFLGVLKEYGRDEYDSYVKENPEVLDWENLDEETQSMVVDELFDELDKIAPEGTYFGANEGDGSDYGFWTVVEESHKNEDSEYRKYVDAVKTALEDIGYTSQMSQTLVDEYLDTVLEYYHNGSDAESAATEIDHCNFAMVTDEDESHKQEGYKQPVTMYKTTNKDDATKVKKFLGYLVEDTGVHVSQENQDGTICIGFTADNDEILDYCLNLLSKDFDTFIDKCDADMSGWTDPADFKSYKTESHKSEASASSNKFVPGMMINLDGVLHYIQEIKPRTFVVQSVKTGKEFSLPIASLNRAFIAYDPRKSDYDERGNLKSSESHKSESLSGNMADIFEDTVDEITKYAENSLPGYDVSRDPDLSNNYYAVIMATNENNRKALFNVALTKNDDGSYCFTIGEVSPNGLERPGHFIVKKDNIWVDDPNDCTLELIRFTDTDKISDYIKQVVKGKSNKSEASPDIKAYTQDVKDAVKELGFGPAVSAHLVKDYSSVIRQFFKTGSSASSAAKAIYNDYFNIYESKDSYGYCITFTDESQAKMGASIVKANQPEVVGKAVRIYGLSKDDAKSIGTKWFNDCVDADLKLTGYGVFLDRTPNESKVSEKRRCTQKELKEMIDDGEAIDITRVSEEEAHKIREKSIEVLAVGMGTYGMNCALLRDKSGQKYAITARNSNLFYFV